MKPDLIEQLRKAIAKGGQSQYAIAKATGISQPMLNRFVNGERSISLETASRLCDHLKLELRQR
ncbi:MAG: helix-turn-helix domain-containing protein [Pirellulales bacterium]